MASPADSDPKFRLMFERSADAILLLDTSVNKFIEYNQAALDMLRCSRAELSALHPSELSPERQPDGSTSFESANERIAAAVRAGSNRFEWTHRSPHRPDFPVEVLLTPIQAPLVLVVWRDITERKRNEEALRQAQKLESLGVLAGGIAHDFNNLLTALNSHLTLAQAGLPAAHPAGGHLAQLEKGLAKAANLSRQMLAYSGHGGLQVEVVDLNAAVTEMVDLLRAAVTGGVRLEVEPCPDQVVIEANRVELEQVIMNAVTNAAEASRPGGVVTIRTSVAEVDAAVIASQFAGQPMRPGRHALLEVIDEGRGMSPAVLERVFDPFFSTKGEGRGLGLSVLSGIVRGHLGGLRLRSQEGAGTSFVVALPATDKASAPLRPVVAERGRGTGLLLVVDDDPAIRRSTRMLLGLSGFTVLEAPDGASAVETYARHLGEIRLVLMDLTMPGMNGHQAFLQMRALDPKVKVVLSSGWAKSELTARFRADPPLAFMPKPYRNAELEEVLRGAGLLDA